MAVGVWQGYNVEQCEQLTTNPYEDCNYMPAVSPIKTTPQEHYKKKTYHLESDVNLSLDHGLPRNEQGMSIF